MTLVYTWILSVYLRGRTYNVSLFIFDTHIICTDKYVFPHILSMFEVFPILDNVVGNPVANASLGKTRPAILC